MFGIIKSKWYLVLFLVLAANHALAFNPITSAKPGEKSVSIKATKLKKLELNRTRPSASMSIGGVAYDGPVQLLQDLEMEGEELGLGFSYVVGDALTLSVILADGERETDQSGVQDMVSHSSYGVVAKFLPLRQSTLKFGLTMEYLQKETKFDFSRYLPSLILPASTIEFRDPITLDEKVELEIFRVLLGVGAEFDSVSPYFGVVYQKIEGDYSASGAGNISVFQFPAGTNTNEVVAVSMDSNLEAEETLGLVLGIGFKTSPQLSANLELELASSLGAEFTVEFGF